MKCFHIEQYVIQAVEALAAHMSGDYLMRALPTRSGGGDRGDTLTRQRDFTRSCIATGDDGHELPFDQRVEIARQRRAVEQVLGRELADPQRSLALQRAQQRKLRDTQSNGLQRVVIELRNGARRTAKA